MLRKRLKTFALLVGLGVCGTLLVTGIAVFMGRGQ